MVAFGAMQGLMVDPEVGIELHHVVHGQQKFVHERPIVVGDRLTATLTVSGLRQIAGTDIITTSSAITDDAGALVCTAEATLVHQGGCVMTGSRRSRPRRTPSPATRWSRTPRPAATPTRSTRTPRSPAASGCPT